MVNLSGVSIKPDRVIDLLKRELTFHNICRQLAYQRIIRTQAEERAVAVTDDEIQAEADSVRRELQIESAQKTYEWLEERLITADDWEESIRDRLLSEKLADAMFSTAATQQFNQQKLDYERISLYKIVTADRALAQELAYQIEEEEISFFEAAHRYDSDPYRRRCCGYEGEISRWALSPDVAASVFSAAAKTVVGPVFVEPMYGLFFVDEFIEPELTPETYCSIRDRLFHDWLNRELQRLDV